VKLALQISQSDVEILHGHLQLFMAEQLHEDREAHTGAKQLRSIGVSELMRNDARGDA
jgi:hypothetical protein